MKVMPGTLSFASPTGDGTAILKSHIKLIYHIIVLSYRTIYPEITAQFLIFYRTLSDGMHGHLSHTKV